MPVTALSKYGRDLTAHARAGRLDPLIGRDDEIRRSALPADTQFSAGRPTRMVVLCVQPAKACRRCCLGSQASGGGSLHGHAQRGAARASDARRDCQLAGWEWACVGGRAMPGAQTSPVHCHLGLRMASWLFQ